LSGKYLHPRGKDGIWQLRVPVPRALSGGKARTRSKSLGTTDYKIAQKRAIPLLNQWNAEFASSVASIGSNQDKQNDLDIDQILVEHIYNRIRTLLDEKRRSADSLEDFISRQKRSIAEQTRKLLDGDRAGFEGAVDGVLRKLGIELDKNSEEYSRLVEGTGQASIAALDVTVRTFEGEIGAEPKTPIIKAALTAQNHQSAPGETLIELFELWAEESLAKRSKRKDTIEQDRKVIYQFSDFIGARRSIRSITAIDVSLYRETLRMLPPKWSANKLLHGLSMKEAAKKARELKLKQTAFTTINKHLSTISPVFKWVAQKPEFAGLQNPCTGLFHDKVKGNNPRPPLQSHVLNVIFSSPLFTGFQENGKEHKLGDCLADDWRKWIPLIALFTGARIGEVAQLRLSDIRCDHDIWYFLIAHDEQAGLTTKSGVSRIAVMHDRLQQLGFIEFVDRRLKASNGDKTVRLFAELVPNGRGQIGDAPSRWWRKYLKNIQVKSGADGFGAHSFRHELADRLRVEADLLDYEVGVCLGHNIKSTTSGYGSVSQGTLKLRKEWMDRVTWKGVDFSKIKEFDLTADGS